jgi:nucleoside-diphosphate-sugar epimerase
MIMIDNPLAADLDHILDHTRELWEEVREQRIFLTGGTGFIGRWLVESFVWANDSLRLGSRMTILSRSPEGFLKTAPHLATHAAITIHPGDVRTFEYPSQPFGYVVHAASSPNRIVLNADAQDAADIIVKGTQHTLEFSRYCGSRKFLFLSSGAVYGNQSSGEEKISEEYPGVPNHLNTGSTYGEAKRRAEQLCAQYSARGSFQSTMARCFSLVGPFMHLDTHFAVGNFLRDALAGARIRVTGDGTPVRSYLYSADLAIWLWTILFRGKPLQPYNVGSENAISLKELAEMIARLSPTKTSVELGEQIMKGNRVDRYIPSTDLARNELCVMQWIDLDTALQKTMQWFARNT